MSDGAKPEYLYHYTTVDAFRCILDNKTIRFSPLSKMDDLDESKGADLSHAGGLVYASSWTAEAEESIPMWREYSCDCTGVRIRLKANPFLVFGNYCLDQHTSCVDTVENCIQKGVDYTSSLYPTSLMLAKKFVSPQLSGTDSILHKVEYTDDTSLLFPTLMKTDNGELNIQLSKLGKHKRTSWAYQNEWRYLFFAAKFSIDDFFKNGVNIRNKTAAGIIYGDSKQPFDYLDLFIDPAAFDAMEVILGPKMPYDLRCHLFKEIKSVSPSIDVLPSCLDGHIK